jgi:IS1 family transposase
VFSSLPLDSFVCQTPHCPDFQQSGRQNITLRRFYGSDKRRLLRCRTCGTTFSETKGTPYWGSKLPPERIDSVVDHLTHGNCFSSTASLTRCHRTTVARIMRQAGVHLQQFHSQHARDLEVTSMQADERHSFVGEKAEQAWDFTVVDPKSKFVIEGQVGARTAELTKVLLIGARKRLATPNNLVLFTDGYLPYQSLFPELFGTSWQPPRQGKRGRFPQKAYRIPRSLAHVRVIKEYSGKRVVGVRTEIAAGTQKRVNQELQSLGYTTPNTSAVERQNATARRMNPHLTRKSLAFARLPFHRVTLAHLVQGVYNWCRTQRGLRRSLIEPIGRKKYLQQTPAMAIGLTSQCWTIRDLLSLPCGAPCRS